MAKHDGSLDEGALSEAREKIAEQATEIERLRNRLEGENFAQELKETLTLAMASGQIAAPVTHSRLLEMIVEVAAQVINARAASLYLMDEAAQDLTFEVATGPKASEVKKFRVPVGHGIAGLVALTGQPMALSDASQDPRQASEIARSIGYAPQSMLCVPLFYNDQITGVLQLLDKVEGTFTPGDMETLSLFANQAGVAIEQSRAHDNVTALIGRVLESLGGEAGPRKGGLEAEAGRFAATLTSDPQYNRALELAHLVREIVSSGENEAAACRQILESFAAYLRLRGEGEGAGASGFSPGW